MSAESSSTTIFRQWPATGGISRLHSLFGEDSDTVIPSRGCEHDNNIIHDEQLLQESYEQCHLPQLEQYHAVCVMCGDLGLVELLFLCIRCSYRHQHTYCSRSYPDVGAEELICNWCLHDDELVKSASTSTTVSIPSNDMIQEGLNRCVKRKVIEEHVMYMAADGEQQVKNVKTSHSKAFEYLLMVCFPHIQPGDDEDDDGPLNKASERELDNTKTFNMQGTFLESKFGGDQRLDNIVAGPINPKRQRCAPKLASSVDPSSKCRSRKGPSLSPNSRPNYRRYKLLADVLC